MELLTPEAPQMRTPAKIIFEAKTFLNVASDPPLLDHQMRNGPAIYFEVAQEKAKVDVRIAEIRAQITQEKNVRSATEGRVYQRTKGRENPATGKVYTEKDIEAEQANDLEILSASENIRRLALEAEKQEVVSKMYYDLLVALKDASDICQRIYGNQAVERAMSGRDRG